MNEMAVDLPAPLPVERRCRFNSSTPAVFFFSKAVPSAPFATLVASAAVDERITDTLLAKSDKNQPKTCVFHLIPAVRTPDTARANIAVHFRAPGFHLNPLFFLYFCRQNAGSRKILRRVSKYAVTLQW